MANKKTQTDYTIPLSHITNGGVWTTRTNQAVRAIKKFVKRHWRTESVSISNEVNEHIWQRGKFKIPRKIEVTTKEINGKVKVYLKGSELMKEEEKALKKQEKDKTKKKEEKKTKEQEQKDEENKKKQEEKKEKEQATKAAEYKK